MALKSTIFRAELNVADVDRHYYADHTLTLARHPSETDERMMLRLLAFARHADPALSFCKGISDTDEPDLWQIDLTGAVDLWIELGQPDERRIAKACGRAARVVVYAYGGQTTKLWWQQIAAKLSRFRNLSVFAVAPESMRELGRLAQRSMRLQATLQEGHLMLSGDVGTIEVGVDTLFAPD